jgi:hypothetical protein
MAPPEAPNESICLLFHFREGAGVDAVVGLIVKRRERMPEDEALRSLYGADNAYRAWWQLAQVARYKLPSLDLIPGRSRNGLTATSAFARSQLSFAYWDFGMPLADLIQLLTK